VGNIWCRGRLLHQISGSKLKFWSCFGAEILNQVVQKRSHFGAEDVLIWSYFGAEILNQVTRWCRKDPIFGAEDVLFRYQKSGMYSALLFPTGYY